MKYRLRILFLSKCITKFISVYSETSYNFISYFLKLIHKLKKIIKEKKKIIYNFNFNNL